MKKIIAVLLWFVASALAGFAQRQNGVPAEAKLSPAEQAIGEVRRAIEKNPNDADSYSFLALALARRARETSDVGYYSQAEEILTKSLAIAPENFLAEKTRVWLLLGKHEFAQALESAKTLNKRAPDDVTVYGFLTDAYAELGNYDDAEKATNWMLRLRPGSIPGLSRAAYLRELFGDLDGALDLMNMAYQSTPPSQVEDGAWFLTQMAHLKLTAGKTGEADQLLQRALTMFPSYHYALGNLAKVRIQQQRYGDAVDLLRQRYAAAPHPENLYDLAVALELSGKTDQAKDTFTEFEAKSLLESGKADNSNHELVFYYADHAREPGKALEVAQREYARRHDVYTRDAYAWALHSSGQDVEARNQIEIALAVGVRDTEILRHAGEIALKLGDRLAAERYLQNSVADNAPSSHRASGALVTFNDVQASK
jgi:tetratricopeptide (TPR) repeat protein